MARCCFVPGLGFGPGLMLLLGLWLGPGFWPGQGVALPWQGLGWGQGKVLPVLQFTWRICVPHSGLEWHNALQVKPFGSHLESENASWGLHWHCASPGELQNLSSGAVQRRCRAGGWPLSFLCPDRKGPGLRAPSSRTRLRDSWVWLSHFGPRSGIPGSDPEGSGVATEIPLL